MISIDLSRLEPMAESAIIAFYNCLKAQVQKQINEAEQDMRYADRFFFDNNGSAIELLTEMNAAIHNLSSSIQIYSSMDFRNNRSFAASDDLDAVSESLSELLDRIDDMLIWIEQHGSNTELVYCPKNTKEIVSRLYFNGDERTILTSATLTNATSGSLEEQYSYFISNTGFPAGDRGCLSEPKPSPYPYDEHAMCLPWAASHRNTTALCAVWTGRQRRHPDKINGKATISMQTEGRSRGQSKSYSQNTQRLGRELMTPSELVTMPGDRCILQLRGLPPFYSKKYDLKQHPNYRFTAEADKVKNAFDLDRLIDRRRRPGMNEECETYEVSVPDEAITDEDEDILNYDDLDDPDAFV